MGPWLFCRTTFAKRLRRSRTMGETTDRTAEDSAIWNGRGIRIQKTARTSSIMRSCCAMPTEPCARCTIVTLKGCSVEPSGWSVSTQRAWLRRARSINGAGTCSWLRFVEPCIPGLQQASLAAVAQRFSKEDSRAPNERHCLHLLHVYFAVVDDRARAGAGAEATAASAGCIGQRHQIVHRQAA